MLPYQPRIRLPRRLLPAAAVVLLLTGGNGTAHGFIDIPLASLSKLCERSHSITVFRVEKVNRDKKALIYRKVRDMKGTIPGFVGETVPHVLGPSHNPNYHRQDVDNEELLNDSILAWAAEGKTAVMFAGGAIVCTGHAWYTAPGIPPVKGPWVVRGSADSRLPCLFCADAAELISAVTNLLAGNET